MNEKKENRTGPFVTCIEESQIIHSGYSPERFLLPLFAHPNKFGGNANPAKRDEARNTTSESRVPY
jgi:hypothetical protein